MNRVSGTINYGHLRPDGGIQTLEEHLRGTAALAGSFCSKVGLSDVGQALGLLHDLGKASSEFTDYILGYSDAARGDVDHSTAGAQYIHARQEPYTKGLTIFCARQIMELAIASHHSGLMDCISLKGEDTYSRRMSKEEADAHFQECVDRLDTDLRDEIDRTLASAELSLASMVSRMIDDAKDAGIKDMGHFRIGLLARMILGCLVDADRLDTSSFMDNSTYTEPKADWQLLEDRLDERIASFQKDDAVSRIREEISDKCFESAAREPGIYRLSVPTGGGKTLSSMRFAIEHARIHGMDRIIYVVPYTTIIEQNAEVVRHILERDAGEHFVEECHSNIDIGSDDSEQSYSWAGASSRWDVPIVFTTMVQFLETLFAPGTKRVHRMHSLARSVLIFDEVQSLPVKTTYMFNEALNFLTKYCGSTALLCTATQPSLDRNLDYALDISSEPEVVADVAGLFESLRRVDVTLVDGGRVKDMEDICRIVLENIIENDSVLVVVNTKRMARTVHSMLNESVPNARLYHLSTDMCVVHRSEVITDMVGRLGKEKVICVSTQLIEAGVDVDFNVVVRSMAGLDSIIQAAGRCNRNGRMDVRGKVFVIKTNEDLGRLPDILEGRRCTEEVAAVIDDLMSIDAIERYFDLYMGRRSGDRKDMYYQNPDTSSTLFEMLSRNQSAVMAYKSREGIRPAIVMCQAFHEANSRFHVIDRMDSVVVAYDSRAREALDAIAEEKTVAGRGKLLKVLQRYSVNTFRLQEMVRDHIATEISPGSGIFRLVDGYYDDTYGVVSEPVQKSIIF